MPLLLTRTGEYLRARIRRVADQPKEPSKVFSARFRFYLTLLLTLAWFVLFLFRYQIHSELDRGMIGLIVMG